MSVTAVVTMCLLVLCCIWQGPILFLVSILQTAHVWANTGLYRAVGSYANATMAEWGGGFRVGGGVHDSTHSSADWWDLIFDSFTSPGIDNR